VSRIYLVLGATWTWHSAAVAIRVHPAAHDTRARLVRPVWPPPFGFLIIICTHTHARAYYILYYNNNIIIIIIIRYYNIFMIGWKRKPIRCRRGFLFLRPIEAQHDVDIYMYDLGTCGVRGPYNRKCSCILSIYLCI